MPRWLTTLLLILLFLVFIAPNPARAGEATGNAFESLVVFFRTIGNEVSGTVSEGYSSSGYTYVEEDGQVRAVPTGGPATGDGSFAVASGDSALGARSSDGTGVLGVVGVVVAIGLCLAAFALWAARRAVERPTSDRRARGPGGRRAATALGLALVTAGASVASGAVAHAAEATLPKSAPASLHIPAIDVDTRLVGLGLEADKTMAVPWESGVAGWYRYGPTPGERGPAVITGHVDWQDSAGVFHDLRTLKPGDELTVGRRDGTAAEFRVDRVEQYAKAAFPTEEVFGNLDHAALRLITCGGAFDRATLNYQDNVVVYATMTGVA
jgi:LPXTG-site transpeptidase (sortase) family protein